mmetsp:Transcript_9848/g.15668  ORF Transcript_9848/g.15668 Transcript_9848/m.15668 type:complete len:276 (+) Transcript_9848:1429-2256(+)
MLRRCQQPFGLTFRVFDDLKRLCQRLANLDLFGCLFSQLAEPRELGLHVIHSNLSTEHLAVALQNVSLTSLQGPDLLLLFLDLPPSHRDGILGFQLCSVRLFQNIQEIFGKCSAKLTCCGFQLGDGCFCLVYVLLDREHQVCSSSLGGVSLEFPHPLHIVIDLTLGLLQFRASSLRCRLSKTIELHNLERNVLVGISEGGECQDRGLVHLQEGTARFLVWEVLDTHEKGCLSFSHLLQYLLNRRHAFYCLLQYGQGCRTRLRFLDNLLRPIQQSL